jgi:hypothetical protein
MYKYSLGTFFFFFFFWQYLREPSNKESFKGNTFSLMQDNLNMTLHDTSNFENCAPSACQQVSMLAVHAIHSNCELIVAASVQVSRGESRYERMLPVIYFKVALTLTIETLSRLNELESSTLLV